MCRCGTTMSVYLPHELTAKNSVTSSTGMPTFHITVIYPRTNMPAILHINIPLCFYCSLYIEATFLHTFIKIIKISINYSIYLRYCLKYVPWTNIPLKCHIYAKCPNCLVCVNGRNMPICMPHKMSLQSKLWSVGKSTDKTDRSTVYDCIDDSPNQLKWNM